MGSLTKFKLGEYITKHDSKILIETGTYLGDSIHYGLKFDFSKIYSVELLEKNYSHAKKRFENDSKVSIINNNSIDGLIEILDGKNIGNTIFWLDAHLPNFYDKTYGDDYKKDKDILIPLEEEIKVIVKYKDISNDVFIIDDLRIYEPGSFSNGSWGDVINAGVGGIQFINILLGETHNIEKLYSDEGYIICTPK